MGAFENKEKVVGESIALLLVVLFAVKHCWKDWQAEKFDVCDFGNWQIKR